MSFTQIMSVRTSEPDRLRELMSGWHADQHGTAPGYEGARLLSDREDPDRWLIEVDFTSREEAERNNARPETEEWARNLREVSDEDPIYHGYDLAYATP